MLTIMLIDDNGDDNFYHSRVIKKSFDEVRIIAHRSAIEAINELKSTEEFPDLILLDVNMPRMNGWEFLDELKKLGITEKVRRKMIVMLSTSDNPDDVKKAEDSPLLSGFRTKPLTQEMIKEILS